MYIKAIHIGNSPNPYSPVKYKNFNKDDKAKEEKKAEGRWVWMQQTFSYEAWATLKSD